MSWKCRRQSSAPKDQFRNGCKEPASSTGRVREADIRRSKKIKIEIGSRSLKRTPPPVQRSLRTTRGWPGTTILRAVPKSVFIDLEFGPLSLP